MGATAVSDDPVNTESILVRAVRLVYDLSDPFYEGDEITLTRQAEKFLEDYKEKYGPGAKRVKHIKHPNGVFTVENVDGNSDGRGNTSTEE